MNARSNESQMASALLDMPRPAKRILAVAVDMALCTLAVWLALCLRLDSWVRFAPPHAWAVAGVIGMALIVGAGIVSTRLKAATGEAPTHTDRPRQ